MKTELPVVEFDPASLVGYFDERWGYEILAVPKWNPETRRWEALTNFRGMLAIIEISVTIQGKEIGNDQRESRAR